MQLFSEGHVLYKWRSAFAKIMIVLTYFQMLMIVTQTLVSMEEFVKMLQMDTSVYVCRDLQALTVKLVSRKDLRSQVQILDHNRHSYMSTGVQTLALN